MQLQLKQLFFIWIFIAVIVGCAPLLQPTLAPTHTPTPTIIVTPSPEAEQVTATVTRSPCAFMWATEELPKITTELQAALVSAGLENVTARAYAFGENCNTNLGSAFGAMQTDFDFAAEVTDLSDEEALGEIAATIIEALAAYPADATPGPNPGRIIILFTAGDEQKSLTFRYNFGQRERAAGTTGAALLAALGGLE